MKNGTPAASARASPFAEPRSAPTATTRAPYAGSAEASSSACEVGALAGHEHDEPGGQVTTSQMLDLVDGGSNDSPTHPPDDRSTR